MSGGIFLISDSDDELIELTSKQYDSEDLLQRLLEKYPNLLAGDQMDAAAPRRWLLVTREAAVPGEMDGAGRWSLDHLFLDQEGIPTFVEVKRSTDTRIRREVVGQMLDYAANGVAYWPVEAIRSMYETRMERAGLDPATGISTLLGPEANPDEFWTTVKVNLQAGRIRLVFVADEIPPELRAVFEFLNGQMDPAEVLAVEVRQYAGGSFRGLVPRVIGRTEQVNRKKTAGQATPARQWDEASVLTELERGAGSAVAGVARRLLMWARAHGSRFWWGRGAQMGSAFVNPVGDDRPAWLFAIWTYGKIEIEFQGLLRLPEFQPEELRRELRDRLNRIPGISIGEGSLDKRPSFPIAVLEPDSAFASFVETATWFAGVLGKPLPVSGVSDRRQ